MTYEVDDIPRNACRIKDEIRQGSPSKKFFQDEIDGDLTSTEKQCETNMRSGTLAVKDVSFRGRGIAPGRRKSGRPVRNTSVRSHHHRSYGAGDLPSRQLAKSIELALPSSQEDDVSRVLILLRKGRTQVESIAADLGSRRRALVALFVLLDREELDFMGNRLHRLSWVSLRP